MDSRYYPEQAARFTRDTEHHVLTVIRDEGLYRHLDFKQPGTRNYWYEVITWPGGLTISGDMGSATFRRIDDMLAFFRSGADINPGYWAEKMHFLDGGPRAAKEFSLDAAIRHVEELAREEAEDLDSGPDYEDHPLPGDAAPVDTTSDKGRFEKAIADLVQDMRDEHEDQTLIRALIDDFEHEGFRFSDTCEWDLTDWRYHFLWLCFALRHAVAQYDEHRAQMDREAAA